jgi:hypothetical protein
MSKADSKNQHKKLKISKLCKLSYAGRYVFIFCASDDKVLLINLQFPRSAGDWPISGMLDKRGISRSVPVCADSIGQDGGVRLWRP